MILLIQEAQDNRIRNTTAISNNIAKQMGKMNECEWYGVTKNTFNTTMCSGAKLVYDNDMQ
jgi:hypothetical protein